MPLSDRVYRTVASAAWVLSPILELGDSKLARAARARRTAAERLTDWARRARDEARPLLWLHASSVGEGLQARAVLDAVRMKRPDVQVVFTHLSPSAEGLAARMPADYAGPLPWDAPAEIEPVVRAVRPSVVVFTKNELWPVLAASARAGRARTALVAASLHEGSSRTRWPTSELVRPTLAALDLCAAVGAEDAERFVEAGAQRDVVRTTGDPGVDSAAARVAATKPDAPHLRPFRADPRPTLVAGSTWSKDHARLLLFTEMLRRRVSALRVVIAPHEPSAPTLAALEGLNGKRWRVAKLSRVEASGTLDGADVVLVDRVGVLAELYTIGDAAWVGGGYGRAGLHSVLEPAAAGIPMVFGPRHAKARAAVDLIALGAARIDDDAHGVRDALHRWLADPDARRSAGAAARRYIDDHLGASERTAELIAGLLPSSAR